MSGGSGVVDFRPSRHEGERVRIDELRGKTIIITGFEERASRFHEGRSYLVVRAEVDGRRVFFNTMSKAIVDALLRNEHVFAEGRSLRAKIVQRKNSRGVLYYDFDAPDA